MATFRNGKFPDGVSYVDIIHNGKRIGAIHPSGTISIYEGMISFEPEDLDHISMKAKEVQKFGINVIPVCEYCGGTPGFPKNECQAGNHGLLQENT